MRFESEYCVLAVDSEFTEKGHQEYLVDRIHIGDKVTIRMPTREANTGKISLITIKGIYLDGGKKRDKCFRLNEIAKIERY